MTGMELIGWTAIGAVLVIIGAIVVALMRFGKDPETRVPQPQPQPDYDLADMIVKKFVQESCDPESIEMKRERR